MRYVFSLFIILSIFFSPMSLFAQQNIYQREDLFRAGFQQLPFILSFVYESPEFQNKLTLDERTQIDRLMSVSELIKISDFYRRSYYYTQDLNDESDEILKQDRPTVIFSDNRDEFRINQNEPERLAKTTSEMKAPIYINKLYLNSANINPSYLDVIQLLLHELGHKLGQQKNQLAMDSLGSKIIQFIKPYYQSAKTGASGKVEVISLPFLISRLQFSIQDLVRVIITENGIVNYHILDMEQTAGAFERFTPIPEGSGNILEETTLRLTSLKGKKQGFRTLLEFNVEALSRLVFMDPTTHMQPGHLVIGNRQQMVSFNEKYNLIKPSLSNILMSVLMNSPEKKSMSGQIYVGNYESWQYRDESLKYKIGNVFAGKNAIQLNIFNHTSIQSLEMRFYSTSGELLVPGTKQKTVGNEGVYSFSIPSDIATEDGILKVGEVVVNHQYVSSLPEILSDEVKIADQNSAVPRSELSIYDGKKWLEYSAEIRQDLPEGPLLLRIKVNTADEIKQIRLRWNSGASLSWNKMENIFGTYGSIHEETIENLKLIEASSQYKIYEFESKRASVGVFPEVAEGLLYQDSYKRVLKEYTVVTKNLKQATVVETAYLKLFNNEYLRVSAKQRIGMCSSVFGG